MLTRIELTNFMSHVATVIEPAAGLTVLVGPNNCGKSAVVAALQLLCKNPEAKFAVRHGSRECLVRVEISDGHSIVWRRTKTSASYRLNDQAFDRLGRGIPDSLHELLKLPMVGDESDADFDIHFGSQKSPIFLLNSSPATAARFFASSSDAIRLVEMQRRHKEKLATKQKFKRDLEQESKQLTSELERLEPVIELDRRLQTTAEDHASLLRAAEALETAQRASEALAGQAETVAVCRAEHDVLQRVAPPPELPDPAPLALLRRNLTRAQHGQRWSIARCEVLAKLPLPPTLFDVAALVMVCDSLEQFNREMRRSEAVGAATSSLAATPALVKVEPLERLVAQLAGVDRECCAATSRSAVLGEIETPPTLDDADSLQATIAKLAQAAELVGHEERRLAALSPGTPPPAMEDTAVLRQCVKQLADAAQGVESAQHLAQAAAEQLEVARQELVAFASSAECPTCGSPLDPERVVARAAAGLGGHAHA